MKCDEDISDTIRTLGITVVNDTPAGIQLKVSSESEAKALLKQLNDDNRTVVRFELREPSLHEIFVESVEKGTSGTSTDNVSNNPEGSLSE